MESLVLAILHVTAGALWTGFAVFQGFWLMPALMEAGPAGGAVMGGIMKRKFVLWITVLSWVALITGFRLYMIRFSPAWLTTAEGIVVTLGMLLAIGAAVIGGARQRPTAQKLAALSASLKGPPSPEQAAEMQAVGARLVRIGKVTAFHLLGVLVLMSAHRLAAIF